MIVRAVDIHEPFADDREDVERGRRAIDELAVRTVRREGAFEDKLIFFARFKAVLVEEGFQRSTNFCHVEHSLHRATVAAATDRGAVGTFAENEIERADEDGFARSGFAADDVVAGLEFQRQIGHEGKVFDAQRGQHR